MDDTIDISNIDWNAVWREAHAKKRGPFRDPEFWNERAPDFARHAESGDFVSSMENGKTIGTNWESESTTWPSPRAPCLSTICEGQS